MSIDNEKLLEAARFLKMADLIQRLEKFEADLNQLKNLGALQSDVLMSLFGNQRKRSRKSGQNTIGQKIKMPGQNGQKYDIDLLRDYDNSPMGEDIQIEEVSSNCDSPPPAKFIKKENPIEIEVKVSDPNRIPLAPKIIPVIATGSSRRKGASQVIYQSVSFDFWIKSSWSSTYKLYSIIIGKIGHFIKKLFSLIFSVI